MQEQDFVWTYEVWKHDYKYLITSQAQAAGSFKSQLMYGVTDDLQLSKWRRWFMLSHSHECHIDFFASLFAKKN